jgi:hypothetical protein
MSAEKQPIDEATAVIVKWAELLADATAAIEAWVKKISNDSSIPPQDIALGMFSIIGAHDAIESIKLRLYSAKNTIDKVILPERLDAAGLDMIRVPSIARSFSIRNNMSATMTDTEKALAWLREIGQGDLIRETVNAGTLAAFCRNLLLEQGIEPPEAIALRPYRSISVVKYHPKGECHGRLRYMAETGHGEQHRRVCSLRFFRCGCSGGVNHMCNVRVYAMGRDRRIG